MKNLRKIAITLLLAMLCLVSFVACSKLPTDDRDLKKRGFNIRVTFNGAGGKSGILDEVYIYLKNPELDPNANPSPVPDPRTASSITDFERTGYEYENWYYVIQDENGFDVTVNWDFAKDKVYPGREGVVYDEQNNLYNLDLYPDWSRKLAYEIVKIADNGDREIQTMPINENAEYHLNGFVALSWYGYTQDPDKEFTGYYRDEACTDEIESLSLLSEGHDYPTKGNEHYRIYTKWLKGTYNFVTTASQLEWKNETYYLLNDIDFAGVEYTIPETFSGKLIGNGFTISNINCTYTVSTLRNIKSLSIGLLGALDGATVQDVTFKDCTVNVNIERDNNKGELTHNVGMIAGSVSESFIENLTVTGGRIYIKNIIGGVTDKVSYNKITEYNGVFDETEKSTINGINADITIYDPDKLGV